MIERGADGKATGFLVERPAAELVESRMPAPSTEERLGWLAAIQPRFLAAGITTVCDAVCVGFHGGKSERLEYLNLSIDVLRRARAAGALKAEHLLHLRLEIADPNMLELFEPLLAEPTLRLVSLMDHTPGQRQWQDIDHFRSFTLGRDVHS